MTKTEKEVPVTTPEDKQAKKAKKIRRSRIRFNIYVAFLVVITIVFGAHMAYELYFEPRAAAGQVDRGPRIYEVEPIPDSLVASAESFGATQSGVANVNVTVKGIIVYVDVRVTEGTTVEAGQAVAEKIANHFLEEAGEVADGYKLQLVVSSGNLEDLLETNAGRAMDHIRLHRLDWMEQIVAHAETYPTTGSQGTIDRVLANIDVLRNLPAYRESDVGDLYDMFNQTLQDMEARVNALTPLTADEIEALGEIPALVIEQNIPQSNVNEFPSWGAWHSETGGFSWR